MSTVNVATLVQLESVSCFSCGVIFGLPGEFYRDRLRDGKFWHCPNGHSQHFTETTEMRLKKEKEALERRMASVREDARSAWAETELERRRHAATKGQLTKTRKRVVAGVCPCCNRTFQQLSRHMASKHPDFDPAGE